MTGPPLKLVDRVYWLVRAEDHLDLARQAADERAANAHAYLAAFYLDRVHRGEADGASAEEPGRSRERPRIGT